MSSSPNIRRTRTKQERRKSASDDGLLDPAKGWKAKKQRMWAVRTLVQKHRGACALCGELVVGIGGDLPDAATIDHIVPISKGGLDVPANWQLAHQRCNVAKGNAL